MHSSFSRINTCLNAWSAAILECQWQLAEITCYGSNSETESEIIWSNMPTRIPAKDRSAFLIRRRWEFLLAKVAKRCWGLKLLQTSKNGGWCCLCFVTGVMSDMSGPNSTAKSAFKTAHTQLLVPIKLWKIIDYQSFCCEK